MKILLLFSSFRDREAYIFSEIIKIRNNANSSRLYKKPRAMTFVVTEDCIKCKYTDCVEVCPVECFHEGPNFLVIDPEECIDCALCVPECPIDAIVPEKDLPENQKDFLELNANLSKEWPVIALQKPPPPDADEWRNIPNKRDLLEA